jgi:hypothetical protein
MATSKFAFPYPSPSQPVAQGADAIKALADAVDAGIAWVPPGGAAGAVLAKSGAGDYAAAWSPPHYVPAGGAAGQVLAKSAAADYALTWATPAAGGAGGSGVLAKVTAPVVIQSSTAEATLFDVAIPGGTLGTNGMLRVAIIASIVPSTVGVVFTLRVYFGGTKYSEIVLPNLPVSTGVRPVDWLLQLAARGATNAQKLNGHFAAELGAASVVNPPTGEGTSSNAFTTRNFGANVTEDSTVARNLKVTVQAGSSSPAQFAFDYAVIQGLT